MTGSGASSKEAHAVLSPSSAERWISCPASVRMGSTLPKQEESAYAIEGTIAHALGELEARHAFGISTPAQHTRERNLWRKKWAVAEAIEEEMSLYIEAYVQLLLAKAEEHPHTQLLLEKRMPTGVPSCWGTSDAVLVSPEHVEIIDLKYGSGIRVSAEGNSQLRLYGVGALEMFGDVLGDTKFVTVTVFQPRMENVDSETLTATELRDWRDGLIPVAEEALGDDAHFGPSEEACRWCPASGQCRAQMEWATDLDFGTDPDALTPEDMSYALERIPTMVQWAEAVKTVALDLAYSKGVAIPGYKVVRSGGRRVVSDEDGALDALAMVGHTLDEVSTRKIKGIGELEKLLGKDEFFSVLSPYVTKTTGNPALVPESDKRPSINPNDEAQKEFE